jgi:RES domain-containing protein
LKITSWRVVGEQFAVKAFEGEGARRAGGRWNSAGRAAVYTAATTSLGLLETLVHADLGLLPFYLAIPVSFDADLVESVGPERLPSDWNSVPVRHRVQRIGDDWLASGRTCVLEVPSVIVPHESNFILNPEHPDFGSLEIGKPISLQIDQRLS